MKKNLLQIVLFGALLCWFFGTSFNPQKISTEIKIHQVKDDTKVQEYLGNIINGGFSQIKNKDVEIYAYKGDSGLNVYRIIYFHNYSGKMGNFGAVINDSILFSRAYYSWVNDTMINIEMTNPKTGDSYLIHLFGNYHEIDNKITKITGMILPD